MARISEERRRAVRQRLLEAAADHFGEAGYDRANIDAISLAAGCAKGTVYNYFPSKEALFGAVIEEAARRAAERYREVEPTGSTRDRLLALARADVAVLREHEPFVKVLVLEALRFHPDRYAAVTHHLGPYLAEVSAVLARGAARGEVRADVPVDRLALVFVGTLALLYGQRWGSGGQWPTLDEVPDLAVTIFFDGASRARSEP